MASPVTIVVPVEAPLSARVSAGLRDLRQSARDWRIWGTLAIRSVGQAYRKTFLGPWWITVQTLAFIVALSILHLGISGSEQGSINETVPYIAVGFIIFQLVTTGLTTGAGSFVAAGQALSTSRLPYSSYVLKDLTRQTSEFLHNCVVIVLVMIIFRVHVTTSIVLVIPAFILIVAAELGTGLILGPLVARFRDLGPIIESVVRMMFFFTPVFWVASPGEDGLLGLVSRLNPLTYQLDSMRSAILGQGPLVVPLIVSAVIAVVSLVVGFVVFTSTRAKLPYWVD